VAGAAKAIDDYAHFYGAEQVERHTDPSGRIVHAELAVGDARMTLKEEDATDGGSWLGGSASALLMLAVDDVAAGRAHSGGGRHPSSSSPGLQARPTASWTRTSLRKPLRWLHA